MTGATNAATTPAPPGVRPQDDGDAPGGTDHDRSDADVLVWQRGPDVSGAQRGTRPARPPGPLGVTDRSTERPAERGPAGPPVTRPDQSGNLSQLTTRSPVNPVTGPTHAATRLTCSPKGDRCWTSPTRDNWSASCESGGSTWIESRSGLRTGSHLGGASCY